MDRWACVDARALPLQLLLARHPDWRAQPAAVVAEDRPQALVEWVNEAAYRAGVRTGQRYAAALSLAPALRADVVTPAALADGSERLLRALLRHAPGVEPCADEPGVCWLDASGLGRLYASPRAWGQAVLAVLAEVALGAAFVFGRTRFGTYAVAHASAPGAIVLLADEDAEAAAVRRVPLARLPLPPRARDALDTLGIRVVGDLTRLPESGLRKRYGKELAELHARALPVLFRAAPAHVTALAPALPHEPLAARLDLDEPELDVEHLTFVTKQLVDPLLGRLARRGEALAALTLALEFGKDAPPHHEALRPATPTLDGVQLVALVRLRLEAHALPAGVRALALTVDGVPATTAQLELFAARPRRDPEAAARALARLRASYGDDAVGVATLREGHLPEAGFAWTAASPLPPKPEPEPEPEPVSSLPLPPPRPLVRRLYTRPLALPPRPAREPDGWMPRGHGERGGPVVRLTGPHVLSGGWWRREVQRDYYFAELRSGAILWIFYDRVRRRWYLHGEVA